LNLGGPGRKVIVVGEDGLVISSNDSATTWSLVNSNTSNNLRKIYSYNTQSIFVVGDNGTILKSTNYGVNWNPIISPFNYNFNGVSFINPSTGFISSSNGIIIKSTDGGSTWSELYNNPNLTINTFNVSRQNSYCNDVLRIGCNNGRILKSTDLGLTWINEITNTIKNIYYLPENGCIGAYAVGAEGLIIHSTLSHGYLSYNILHPNKLFSPVSNFGNIHSKDYFNFRWDPDTINYIYQTIYSSGLMLAAKVKDERRVAISKWSSTEYFPGQIDFNSQTPYGKNDFQYRIYKVNPNFPYGNDIYDPWENWPVQQGAPWTDENHNGIYDPPIDKPLMKGIENLFCTFTDGYPESHIHYTGSTLPLKAEIHQYVWGKSNSSCLDAIHFEWKIINKGLVNWDSLSIGIWSDPDSKNPTHDLTGCDSSLNLAFSYYRDNNIMNGKPPSAVGYVLYDVSRHDQRQMDFFFDYRKHFGPTNYNEVFNAMMGLNKNGSIIINPLSNQSTKYYFSGDPESGTGWLETEFEDQQMLLGSYIGTVLPLDTIKFNMVNYIARGSSNTNSVTLLKQCAGQVININSVSTSIPSTFSLSQNYPNPFNPTTNIRFQIPESGFVTLKVFDITGREVAMLVNEQMNAGEYNYQFSTDEYKLSSGVYFYRLTANDKNGKMNFSQTKKMVVVR
jgi:hypothetical protein